MFGFHDENLCIVILSQIKARGGGCIGSTDGDAARPRRDEPINLLSESLLESFVTVALFVLLEVIG